MLNLTYEELLKKVEKYNLDCRYSVVSFCMGYLGKLDDEHFNMINKMYVNGIINE